jgi:hypothetical protein
MFFAWYLCREVILTQSGIDREIKHVFSSWWYYKALILSIQICWIYLVSHRNKFYIIPSRSSANIFHSWLNGVETRFKLLIRVKTIVIIWSLRLYRNKKIFNDNNNSLMHAVATLLSWSSLQRVEHRNLLTDVSSTRLEDTRNAIFR